MSNVSERLLSEDELLCSICLDIFSDPVSTPCGHNFCLLCLRECWNSTSPCQCPVCKENFPGRPELRVNTFISELTARFRSSLQIRSETEPCSSRPPGESRTWGESCTRGESCTWGESCTREESCTRGESCTRSADTKHKRDSKRSPALRSHDLSQLEMRRADGENMIRVRVEKIKELKRYVEINTNAKEKLAADGTMVFCQLIGCLERHQAKFLNQIEEQHRAVETQSSELIQELERDIIDLQDPQRLLQKDRLLSSTYSRFENWTYVSLDADVCEGMLRRALFQVHNSIQKEISKLDEIKLKRIRRFSVDVTLNPDTAHPYLHLSLDGKRVRCAETAQNLPNNRERFDRCPCVLGVEGFSSGRSYFRVRVAGKTDWDLGVAGESAGRKGMISACPGTGFWSVCLRNSTQYMACDSRWVSLPMKRGPQEVGVFVDYEQGVVDFYDLTAKSLMYSFSGQTFTEKLHPYLSPCLNNGGRNASPLVILPELGQGSSI